MTSPAARARLRSRSLLLVLALGLAAAACGDGGSVGSGGDDTAAPDTGLSNDGFVPVDPGGPPDTGGAEADAADAGDTADAGPDAPGPGDCAGEKKGFLCPCEFNVECLSGWCVQVEDMTVASVCTVGCGEAPCPDDWSCKEVFGTGDTNFICVQEIDFVCNPCVSDGDCGGTGDLCLPFDDGTYCTRDCQSGDDPCGPGTACLDVTDAFGDVVARQCQPVSGSCTCAPEIDLMTDPDHCGKCNRACEYDGGVAGCTGGECELLTCKPGFVNLDEKDGNGCEYPCTKTSDTDLPDGDGVDANCDGIDGEVARGVFVAPNGNASAKGTMADPLATIPQGITKAKALGKDHVYVAAGAYAEQVVVANGVSVFGGYSADGKWTRDLDLYETVIQPAAPDATGAIRAVVAEGITDETTLGGLVVKAGNNTAPGGSSYAVWVRTASKKLAIVRSRLVAGNGGPGAAGKAGVAGSVGASPQPGVATSDTDCFCDEYDTYGGKPGSGAFSVCASGKGAGGDGGKSGCGDESGAGGKPSPDGAKGGPAEGDGDPGADADDGAHGAGGFGSGVVGADGLWSGSGGQLGKAGGDGLGGGGGGGGDGHENGLLGCAIWGGGGGGGGGGGCGGTPGSGGTAGGGSFALFLVDASPILGEVVLSHKSGGNGGNGGTGGKGGIGKPGGAGGVGFDKGGDGGRGGDGGDGGRGGHGGGGAGGVAYGAYLVGSSAPLCSAVTFEPLGTAGLGGLGGDLTGNRGADGASGQLNVQIPTCP